MTDAGDNACSVLFIHFQGRLHDLTQRDGQMLPDNRDWRYGSGMQQLYEGIA